MSKRNTASSCCRRQITNHIRLLLNQIQLIETQIKETARTTDALLNAFFNKPDSTETSSEDSTDADQIAGESKETLTDMDILLSIPGIGPTV